MSAWRDNMKRRKFCEVCQKITRHNQKGVCIPCMQRIRGVNGDVK